MRNDKKNSDLSGLEQGCSIFNKKGKAIILFYLFGGKKRFSELKRLMTSLNPRSLTQCLRELEKNNLIIRKDYQQVPPKVEYSLTALGESFKPFLLSLAKLGKMIIQ